MTTTTAPTRYTINLDGTLEKWYLEHDGGETIYLRKTPRPKWNCGMKEFPAAEVFPDYKTASAPQRWCRSKVPICVSVSTSRFMASVVVYFASKMILRPPSNVP